MAENQIKTTKELFGQQNKLKLFDPEGAGYDYKSAIAAGLQPDETGHWPSRDPKTGLILKGMTHETINKTLEAEKRLGYKIYKRNGRYYSTQQIKTGEELFIEQPNPETLQRMRRVETEARKRPESKGLLASIKDIPAGMLGATEVAMGAATGFPAYTAGLGTAGVETLIDWWKTGFREPPGALPKQFGKRIPGALEGAQQWTYQPVTTKGQQYTQELGKIFGIVDKLATTAAPFYSSDPHEQLAIKEILTLGVYVAGARVVGGVASAIKARAPLEIGKLKRAIFKSKEIPGTVKKKIAAQKTPDVVEAMPIEPSGFVVASIGADGKVYYGKPGELHINLSEQHSAKIRAKMNLKPGESTWKKEGFAKPGGKVLSREEALKLTEVEAKATPGQLDALDYREQKTVPPEGAVEKGGLPYGAKLPKYAEGVNLERIDLEYGPKKFILDQAELYQEQIRAKRRIPITQEETQAMADGLGLSVETLINKTKTKTTHLDAYITAARDTLNTSAYKTHQLSLEYRKNPTVENAAKFKAALERHKSVQLEVSASSSEIGRALAAHKIASRTQETLISKGYAVILKRLKDRTITDEISKKLALLDPDNPAQVNKFLRLIADVKFTDKIFEAWINSLLFSLQTNVVNTVSNIGMILDKPLTTGVAAALEVPKRLVGKKPEVYFGEAPAQLKGLWHGLGEAGRNMAYAWVNEMTVRGASKIETRVPTAIRGRLGKTTRIPGRMLMTADEGAKAIVRTMEIYAQAYRRVVNEGHKGKARGRRVSEIINNIENYPDILKLADAEAAARTFTLELGKVGTELQRVRTSLPGARYIAPFMKVSMNIPKQAGYRSPLNFGRILYLASKGKLKGSQLAEQAAMATIGTATTIAVFMKAIEGNITGGAPTEKNKREEFLRNKQPYSIKIGDTWYSYERLEPAGTVLGITADAARLWDEMTEGERDKIAGRIVSMFTENLINKTFMRGVSTALKAISDPERGGEYFVRSFVGSMTTSEASQVAKAIDPNIRDIQSILDHVKSRIPGVSKHLPPRHDVYGQPLKREGGIPYQLVVPFWKKKIPTGEASVIDKELVRLKIWLGQPSRKVEEEKMIPEDYSVMSQQIGDVLKKVLYGFISSEQYRQISDEEKVKTIKAISNQIRGMGRAPYRMKYQQ